MGSLWMKGNLLILILLYWCYYFMKSDANIAKTKYFVHIKSSQCTHVRDTIEFHFYVQKCFYVMFLFLLLQQIPRWCWSLSEALEREDRLDEGLEPTLSTWASWNSCRSLSASSKCCWPSSFPGSFFTVLPNEEEQIVKLLQDIKEKQRAIEKYAI